MGDRIFRAIDPSFAPEYDFVHSIGLIAKLVEQGHVLSVKPVDPTVLGFTGNQPQYFLEVPKLPFVSFPYE